jgi:hypothetical protein
MSLQAIFDPMVKAYFKKKYGGGGGGTGGGAELVYETDFSISEVPTEQITLATITTGLTLDDGLYMFVITCINDTREDTLNHFRLRTETARILEGYTTVNVNGGWCISDQYKQFGAKACVWVSAAGKYLSTITVVAQSGSANYGHTPTGDYVLRVYKAALDIYGVEGV